MVLFLLTALLNFGSPVANAGPKDGGGGKGIRCVENGRMVTYLADTFELMRSRSLAGIRPTDPRAVVDAASEIIDQIRPGVTFPHPYLKGQQVSLGWMISHRRDSIEFKIQPGGDLPDFPDDHIDATTLPENCHKVQVAYQDLKTGVVATDYNLDASMSFLERGLLELHETLISLRNRPGADTTPIRAEVNSIADVLKDPRLSSSMIATALMNPAPVAPRSAGTEEGGNQALPSLLEWPKELRCHTTYSYKNGYAWRAPRRFILARTSADGVPNAPTSNLTFRLQLADAPVPAGESTQSFFSTDRFRRDGAYRPHASFSFSATWAPKGKKPVTIFISAYNERTKELVGSIQAQPSQNGRYDKFQSHGLVCDGSHLRIGYDSTK